MLRALPALLLIVALSGCAAAPAAAPTAEPKPTPTAAANDQACKDFGAVTLDLTDVMVNPPADQTMIVATEGMLERFDSAYLAADGEVAKRLEKLVDELPEKGLYMLYIDDDDYIANAKAVTRACEAEGVDFNASVWK